MIKKALLTSLFFILSFNVFSFELNDLQMTLTSHKLLRGEFTQEKKMKMFKAPLLSGGTFLLTEKEGLVWSQKMPFPVSLVLIKDKLSQQFSGQKAQVIEAKTNPMVFYFSHLFLSLFKGDIKALEDQFKLSLSGDSASWTLKLVPKSAPLNKVFSDITITGGEFINGLRLSELNGDMSNITFSQQKTLPKQLTSDEKRAFNF